MLENLFSFEIPNYSELLQEKIRFQIYPNVLACLLFIVIEKLDKIRSKCIPNLHLKTSSNLAFNLGCGYSRIHASFILHIMRDTCHAHQFSLLMGICENNCM